MTTTSTACIIKGRDVKVGDYVKDGTPYADTGSGPFTIVKKYEDSLTILVRARRVATAAGPSEFIVLHADGDYCIDRPVTAP